MSDDELEWLVAYLQKNAGRFSLQSLWDQMLRDGYDPALVNRAIAEYDRRPAVSESAPPVPQASTGSKVAGFGCGIVLGILIIVALIILAVGGLCVLVYVEVNKRHH